MLEAGDFHFLDVLYAKVKASVPGLEDDFVIVHGDDPIISAITDGHTMRLGAFLAQSRSPSLIVMKLNNDVINRLRRKHAGNKWSAEFWARIGPPVPAQSDGEAEPLAGGGRAALANLQGRQERARTRLIDAAGHAQDGPQPGQQWPLVPQRENITLMGPVGAGEEMITVRKKHAEFLKSVDQRLYVFEIDMIPPDTPLSIL
jgi:hypothetical protein